MNPVIYAVVDPTAADVKDRLMPVSGTDNGDGTCSLDTTGGGGAGGADSTAANQVLQLAQETAIAASLASIDAGIPAALGQTTKAASLSVVQASDAVTPNSALAVAITVANAVTSTGAVAGVSTIQKGVRTWVLRGTTSAGAGTATVLAQGSLDGTDWVTIGTMSLTLATTATMDSFTEQSSFVQFRASVTALTGTGASVTLKVGV